MFRLRRELDVYANLRPSHCAGDQPADRARAVGRAVLRRAGVDPDGTVYDRLEYHPDQIERLPPRLRARAGARGQLTSVDKANVLATSRLWRATVDAAAPDYPGVEGAAPPHRHAGMRLVEDPTEFDVLVTENTFGDILSDVAAALTGGIGIAASACIGDGRRALRAGARDGAGASRATASPTRRRCCSPPR